MRILPAVATAASTSHVRSVTRQVHLHLVARTPCKRGKVRTILLKRKRIERKEKGRRWRRIVLSVCYAHDGWSRMQCTKPDNWDNQGIGCKRHCKATLILTRDIVLNANVLSFQDFAKFKIFSKKNQSGKKSCVFVPCLRVAAYWWVMFSSATTSDASCAALGSISAMRSLTFKIHSVQWLLYFSIFSTCLFSLSKPLSWCTTLLNNVGMLYPLAHRRRWPVPRHCFGLSSSIHCDIYSYLCDSLRSMKRAKLVVTSHHITASATATASAVAAQLALRIRVLCYI